MNIYMQSAHKKLEGALGNSLANPRNSVAAVFKLSQLKIRRDNREHVNIAANILKDSMKSSKGDIYVFNDGDIIVVNSCGNLKEIQESVYQIKYLFSDDPVVANDNDHDNLCKVYDSLHDWDTFIRICERKVAECANDNMILKSKYRNEPLLKIISNQIEDCLYDLNWEKLIKSYSIATNPRFSKFGTIINHICYDKSHLKALMSQSAEMMDNPYLLSFIEEYIQLRILIKVLHLVSKHPKNVFLWEISINTLKSEEFELFDQALSFDQKRNLIINIHVGEIFSDLVEYYEIIDKITAAGYRVCIYGLDNVSFLQIDRSLLNADLLMLKWESSIKKQSYGDLHNELKNKIQICGSSRVILSQCISAKSLDIGSSLGINLYEGEYIERFLA